MFEIINISLMKYTKIKEWKFENLINFILKFIFTCNCLM